jgi:uncharacterized protein YvpB
MNKKWWLVFLFLLLGIIFWWPRQIEYSPEAKIVDFPLYEQPDNITCGPTSLRMLLKYYGKECSLDEIRKKAKTDFYVKDGYEIGGTTMQNMKIALNHFGVPSTIKNGNMNYLRWYIDQGRPPIILLRSGIDNSWHFVVAVGYTKDKITIADPGDGLLAEYSNEPFERAWSFTHDLYYEESALKDCWFCGGDGRTPDWVWLGPIGKCDNCNGSGKLPDIWWIIMSIMDQNPYTYLVPDYSKE